MFLFILLFNALIASSQCSVLIKAENYKYEPTWESLDSRPLPDWFDEAKIGIFLHWGVFSVPSFGSEWFWMYWKVNSSSYVKFMEDNYAPGFTYQEFAKDFTAEFFVPDEWAKLFKAAGAKYVVLTSKHHEGYTLWPSKYSTNWNSVDVGPHRDLIADLSQAVRKAGLKFGLYHSMFEWFHPLYLEDKASNFTQTKFSTTKILPELAELVKTYKPSVLWSDGDWEATDVYWKSKEFLAWLYNESPVKNTIVVNDRWGIDIPCKHGGFFSCADRFNPGVLQKHKWENAMTLDKDSWGYRRHTNVEDYLTTHELITTLMQTVSCGGNILINVGPTKEGTIEPIFQERLKNLGSWLETNGEAIYGSKPWKHQNDTIGNTWYTANLNSIYAVTLEWPENNVLQLESALELFKTVEAVTLLGYKPPLTWQAIQDKVEITFPQKSEVNVNWAWVVKIETSNYIY